MIHFSIAVDVCEEALPLGLSEGLIEDRNLLATTMKDVAHSPVFARLRNDSAWCTDEKSSSRPHYLRVLFNIFLLFSLLLQLHIKKSQCLIYA